MTAEGEDAAAALTLPGEAQASAAVAAEPAQEAEEAEASPAGTARGGRSPVRGRRAAARRARIRLDTRTMSLALALLVLVIIVAWLIAPGLFTSFNPDVGQAGQQFLPPSPLHWFGTDEQGRDAFARVVYGTRQTMLGAVSGVALGLVAGSLIGVIAATARGVAEALIMRFIDVLMAVPGFLLALCIVTGLGPGTLHIALGVGISGIAPFARITRGEALRVSRLEYVEAGRLAGISSGRVLLAHVLPNSAGPILALIPVEFGAMILNIAALGFLGYGAPPPTPEWGTLLSDGRNYLEQAWWLTTLPGIVVVMTVLAIARVGYAVQARYQI
jgi:peptide/nickel transport system permease protein